MWKSRDHKYLFVESGSHTTSEVRYLPADTGTAEMKVIAERIPEQEYDVDHRDGTFWIRTNDQGRNFRLVTAPASDYFDFEAFAVALPRPLVAHPPTPARSDYLVQHPLWPTRSFRLPPGRRLG